MELRYGYGCIGLLPSALGSLVWLLLLVNLAQLKQIQTSLQLARRSFEALHTNIILMLAYIAVILICGRIHHEL